MDEAHERELARGLREGRADAWRALYDAHAERVWRGVARLMGGDAAAVADVVQETFLAAARSAAGFDPARGPVWRWLWGIARRHVALYYRKQKRHDRLRPDDGPALRCLRGPDPAPPELLADAELAALVRATLAELPDEYETVLTARYLDGESVEHIAGRDGSTITAVRSRLARARQALRQMLLRHAAFADDTRPT